MEKQNQIECLQKELQAVQHQIRKLEGVRDITDRVASSFHLGMVGSSGRNTAKLNRKREAALDKAIERAQILTKLYARERSLLVRIGDFENDGPAKRAANKQRNLEIKAEYWRNLKPGDIVTLYTGNQITVQKKNRKSIFSENCKWTAAEIIGREAAKLL